MRCSCCYTICICGVYVYQNILNLANARDARMFNVPADGTEKRIMFHIEKVAHEFVTHFLIVQLICHTIVFIIYFFANMFLAIA